MNYPNVNRPMRLLMIVAAVCVAALFAYSTFKSSGLESEASSESQESGQKESAGRAESARLQLRRAVGGHGSRRTFEELRPFLEAYAQSGADNSGRLEMLKFLIASLEDLREAEQAVAAMCRLTEDLDFRLDALELLGAGHVKSGVRLFIFDSAKIEELGKLSDAFGKTSNDGERQQLVRHLVEKMSDKASFDALNDWIGSNVDASEEVTAKGSLVNKLEERIPLDAGLVEAIPFSELKNQVPTEALQTITDKYAASYLESGAFDLFRETMETYPLARRLSFVKELSGSRTLSEKSASALAGYARQLSEQSSADFSGGAGTE